MSDESEESTYVDPLDLMVEAKSGRKSVGRFRDIVRRSVALVWGAGRLLVVCLVVLQIAAALALAAQVLVIQALLNAILELPGGQSGMSQLLPPVVALAVLTAVTAITGAVQGNIQRLLGERVARTMWHQVLDVATGVSLRHFEAPGFYDRLQRVQASAVSRPFQVTTSLMAIGGALAASIGVALAIVSLHPVLLPLLVLGGLPMLFTSRRESRLEFDFTVRRTPNDRLRWYLTYLQTHRDEAKEIRAFGLAPKLRGLFDKAYATYLGDLAGHLRKRSLLNVLGNLLAAVMLALTMLVLVWLIADGQVGVAAAGAAIVAIRMLASQVQLLFGGMQQIFECGLFLDDVNDFMRLGPSTAREEGGATPPDFDEIVVDDVSFSYPGANRPALDRVSMRVGAGEVVALVGENGSGKTTLAKLLASLYDPDTGAIRWNGQDSRTYQRSQMRDQVAVIFQDFIRYALSARDNIAFGRPEAHEDPSKVAAAARTAGADKAIESLPHGYDTPLSRMFSGGRDLSGGQWQRVALARAFYRNAPLVILDEPTSALDPRAEHDLFASLREVLAGRAAVFVSHRFSTVRSADRIYVLEAGRVVEGGSHDELMALNGQYADLFRLQASAYLSPGEAPR